MQKISAFYIEKQKSFIPKKKLMAFTVPNISEGFGTERLKHYYSSATLFKNSQSNGKKASLLT